MPGNRFEYLEAPRCIGRGRGRRARRGRLPPPARSTCSPSTSWPAPAPHPSMLRNCCTRSAARCPIRRWRRRRSTACSASSPTAAIPCAPMTSFKRLTRGQDGLWRVSHPSFVAQHRLNAGIIVEAPMLEVRFRNGRRLGRVEEMFAASLSPGDTLLLRRAQPRGRARRHQRPDRARHQPPRAHSQLHGRAPRDHRQSRPARPRVPPRPPRMAALPRRRARMARGPGVPLGAPRARPVARRDLPARRPPPYGRLQLRRLERAPVARHAGHAADGGDGA